jgi:hypothetical protein
MVIEAEEADIRRIRRAWRVPGLAVLFVSATLTLGLTSVTTPAAHAASTGVAQPAGELRLLVHAQPAHPADEPR